MDKIITRFQDYISSPFEVHHMNFKFKVDYVKERPVVHLVYKKNDYQKISVNNPESKKLDKDEFFMSSKVDKDIVEELIDQGFIEKTESTSKEGEDDVFSYKIV